MSNLYQKLEKKKEKLAQEEQSSKFILEKVLCNLDPPMGTNAKETKKAIKLQKQKIDQQAIVLK